MSFSAISLQAFSHLGLIATVLDLERAKRDPSFARVADHEKFQRSVGATIGIGGVIAGFWRVPKTVKLLFGSRSKWQYQFEHSPGRDD